jgi:signal transduction histidine kinase
MVGEGPTRPPAGARVLTVPLTLGLGLALVREVLAAYGGSLGVAGRPGEGATFIMIVPAAAAG